MAVGKGSIMRASNAVKEKKAEDKESKSGSDAAEAILQKDESKAASFAVFDGARQNRKTKEVLWISLTELKTITNTIRMTRHEEIALKSSLSQYGFLSPMIVWKRKSGKKEELIVLDGLKRLEVAQKINLKEAPVIVSQVENAAQANEIRRELHKFTGSSITCASYEIEQGIASQIPVYLL